MAYKWVDESKLNAALTASADAIREKTGDTAQINFDMENETGFESAIEEIKSGGSAIVNLKNNSITLRTLDIVVDSVTINGNGYILNDQWGRELCGMRELTLNFDDDETVSYYQGLMDSSDTGDYTLKRIVLNHKTSSCGRFDSAFLGRKSLEEIVGPFDLTSMTYFDKALPVGVLREVRFVPNTIKNNFNPFGYPQWDAISTLSNDSLISMANGLDQNVSGKTFKIASGIGSKLQSILGTVSEGLFTADEDGETNLLAFITGVKGWTVSA